MTYEPLEKNLSVDLIKFAEKYELLHMIELIQSLCCNDKPNLSKFDIAQLVSFAKLIKLVSSLKFPFWNDDLENYREEDGDAYLEVMNGPYGYFSSWIYDELGVPIESPNDDASN